MLVLCLSCKGTTAMTLKVINPNAYKPIPILGDSQVFELKVTAIIDAMPGAWHNPQDLMEWIANHSYVQHVELIEKADETKEIQCLSCNDDPELCKQLGVCDDHY
jgi:hypothetical protein